MCKGSLNFVKVANFGEDLNVIALDNNAKYVVMGSIHCYPQDTAKAEAFMNTLLNSITFK